MGQWPFHEGIGRERDGEGSEDKCRKGPRVGQVGLAERQHGLVEQVDAETEGPEDAKRFEAAQGAQGEFVVKGLVKHHRPGEAVGEGVGVAVKGRGSVEGSGDRGDGGEDEGEEGEADSARNANAALEEGQEGSEAQDRKEAQEERHRKFGPRAQVPQAGDGGGEDGHGEPRTAAVEWPKQGQDQGRDEVVDEFDGDGPKDLAPLEQGQVADHVAEVVDGARNSARGEGPVHRKRQEVEGVDAQKAAQGKAGPEAGRGGSALKGRQDLAVDEVGRQDKEEVDADASVVVKVEHAKEGVARVAAVRQEDEKYGQAAESVEFGLVVGTSVVGEEVV